MKRWSTSYTIRELQIKNKQTNKQKNQADIKTYLLEWPASKGLTTPNAGMDVNQQEFSFLSGGDAKC